RLADLDLLAEAPVLHPRADHERALALLQMPDGPDEDDRRAVRLAVEHSEAGVRVEEAAAADVHLGVERGAVLDFGRHGGLDLLSAVGESRARPSARFDWAAEVLLRQAAEVV